MSSEKPLRNRTEEQTTTRLYLDTNFFEHSTTGLRLDTSFFRLSTTRLSFRMNIEVHPGGHLLFRTHIEVHSRGRLSFRMGIERQTATVTCFDKMFEFLADYQLMIDSFFLLLRCPILGVCPLFV